MKIQKRSYLALLIAVILFVGVPEMSYGQPLTEQTAPASALAAKPIPPDRDVIFYTVQAGDTLDSIACKFHVKVSTLMAINGLRTKQVRVGQILRIPPATMIETC